MLFFELHSPLTVPILAGPAECLFYMITEDLQAHNLDFCQKYVYIDGGARGVYFYIITGDLEGPAERLFT